MQAHLTLVVDIGIVFHVKEKHEERDSLVQDLWT
jgi:hypothetical protein